MPCLLCSATHPVQVLTGPSVANCAGNGCQSVFVLQPRGLVESRQFLTQDAVLDCCWSECNANQLISACGDGSLKLWDLSLPGTRPLIAFKEHLKEVHAVSWNLVNKDSFLSASWDGQVKHWSPASPQSLATWRLPAQGSVYSVAWSPRWASTFATGSQDKMLKVSCSVTSTGRGAGITESCAHGCW